MRYIVRGIRSSDGLQNLLIEEKEKEFHVERAIVFDCGTEKNKVQNELTGIKKLIANNINKTYNTFAE